MTLTLFYKHIPYQIKIWPKLYIYFEVLLGKVTHSAAITEFSEEFPLPVVVQQTGVNAKKLGFVYFLEPSGNFISCVKKKTVLRVSFACVNKDKTNEIADSSIILSLCILSYFSFILPQKWRNDGNTVSIQKSECIQTVILYYVSANKQKPTS